MEEEKEVQHKQFRREANRESARRYYHRKRVLCGWIVALCLVPADRSDSSPSPL